MVQRYKMHTISKKKNRDWKTGIWKRVQNDIGWIKIDFVTLFYVQCIAWLFKRLNMMEIIEKECHNCGKKIYMQEKFVKEQMLGYLDTFGCDKGLDRKEYN